MIAVALASVILGGLAGAALANAGDGDDRRGPMRFQRGGPAGPGGQQWRWGDGPGSGRGGQDPMPRWRAPGQQGQPPGVPGGGTPLPTPRTSPSP